jgi:hypothetical protein
MMNMPLFGKPEKDPQKALEQADKMLNKGVSGFLTKTFMGKDFVNDMNQSLDRGSEALKKAEYYQSLEGLYQNGLPAKAEVVTIEDTGALVNHNPVVIMQLKVQPQSDLPFDTTVQTMVNKIAIPRVGDTINILYNPNDCTQVVVC